MNINIDLTNINKVLIPKFLPLLYNTKRFMCIYGSAGSGKSAFAAQSILIRILVGYKTNTVHRFLTIRKTANSIRDSVFQEFIYWIRAWNLTGIVKINKSSMAFEFNNGSQIISAGCDDVEKLKSLSGITSIWIEEVSQISLKDFRQINLRLRGITHTKMQIIMTFNPISSMLWLNDYFFINKKDNAVVHHSTWRDNPFLEEVYKEELMMLKEQDENYWRVYSEGEFGVLKNIIYKNYEITNKVPTNIKEIIYGMDFGYNDPSVLIQIGYYDDEFYLKELLYQRGLTNSDLIERLKILIPKKVRRSRIIYADNAEPARIEEICRAGFICKPANKSVKDGIDFCKRSMLHISSNSSNMIKEIQAYKYIEDKNDNVLEEPLKFNDHTCDSFRYGLYSHWGKIRPRAEIAFV